MLQGEEWNWSTGKQEHTRSRRRAVGLLGGLRLTSSRGFSCSPHDDDDVLYSGAGGKVDSIGLDWTCGVVAVRAAKDGGRRKSQMRSEARKKQKSSAAAVNATLTTGRDGLRDRPGAKTVFRQVNSANSAQHTLRNLSSQKNAP